MNKRSVERYCKISSRRREIRDENCQRGKIEIYDVVKDLRIRYKSISPLKDTEAFGDGEFDGVSVTSKKIMIDGRQKLKLKLRVGEMLSILLVNIRRNGKNRN